MGRKFGGAPPTFWGGSVVPICHKVALAEAYISIPSDILIHAAIWPQQIWAENWRWAVPLWGGGSGSPPNTMRPGSRPACMPSFILICPTVWPQYTNVTDRQTGQRTDSKGRTVLQTVAQKPLWKTNVLLFSDHRVHSAIDMKRKNAIVYTKQQITGRYFTMK